MLVNVFVVEEYCNSVFEYFKQKSVFFYCTRLLLHSICSEAIMIYYEH